MTEADYEAERQRAQSEKILLSMDLKLHGPPIDRASRQRMRQVLGEVDPVRMDNNYDRLRRR